MPKTLPKFGSKFRLQFKENSYIFSIYHFEKILNKAIKKIVYNVHTGSTICKLIFRFKMLNLFFMLVVLKFRFNNLLEKHELARFTSFSRSRQVQA